MDIGYGDAITPGPELAEYPVLLAEFDKPNLRIYPKYTVLAEKIDAIISLGMANTRMKDYFDISVILSESVLDYQILGDALKATTQRRSTIFPENLPLGLSDDFANDKVKVTQWNAFLKKNQLTEISLIDLISDLQRKLGCLFTDSLSSMNQRTSFKNSDLSSQL